DSAEGWVGDKERVEVAINARVEEERPEDLRAVLYSDRERTGKVADVRVPLDEIGAAAIPANGPLAAGENFGGRRKPQPSVAEEGRRRRSRFLRCGRRRGRWLAALRTLSRGCP